MILVEPNDAFRLSAAEYARRQKARRLARAREQRARWTDPVRKRKIAPMHQPARYGLTPSSERRITITDGVADYAVFRHANHGLGQWVSLPFLSFQHGAGAP